jgi:hypothetical protein
MSALRTTSICVLLVTSLARAADPPQPEPASPTINQTNFNKIKAGKGTMSEDDVIALLGKPTAEPSTTGQITTQTWTEKTHITAILKDKKTIDLKSQFLPHLKSKRVTKENFGKLSKGMTEAELKAILGPYNQLNNRDDLTTLSWYRMNSFEIQFNDGKVEGWAWLRSVDDDNRPAKP